MKTTNDIPTRKGYSPFSKTINDEVPLCLLQYWGEMLEDVLEEVHKLT